MVNIMPDIKLKDLSLYTDEERKALDKWPSELEPYGKNIEAPNQKERSEFWGVQYHPESEPKEAPSYTTPALDPTTVDPDDPKSFFGEDKDTTSKRPPPGREAASQSYSDVKVVRVIDGDTFIVNQDGKEVRVRIRGYNAPEWKAPGGDRAKRALEDLLRNGQINISKLGRSSLPGDSRSVATVSVGDIQDIGQYLAEKGYGEAALPDGPHGNEWRAFWSYLQRKGVSDDDIYQLKTLADENKLWGKARANGRVHQDTPGWAEHRKAWGQFISDYYRPFLAATHRKEHTASHPAIDRAVGRILGRTPLGPVPDWQEANKERLKPEGKSEWAAWEKTLSPKERNLWHQLKSAGEAYNQMSPYRKRELSQDPKFQEWKKLYDKFLNLTTERWKKQPVHEPRRRRRRHAELSPETQNLLEVS